MAITCTKFKNDAAAVVVVETGRVLANVARIRSAGDHAAGGPIYRVTLVAMDGKPRRKVYEDRDLAAGVHAVRGEVEL